MPLKGRKSWFPLYRKVLSCMIWESWGMKIRMPCMMTPGRRATCR